MIERLRNRRCWGETLPPTGDRCYGERRIKLIESIERQEWVVREAEISQIQASWAREEANTATLLLMTTGNVVLHAFNQPTVQKMELSNYQFSLSV